MKCKKTEYGIELIPETDFEIDCLKHLHSKKTIKIHFEDTWDCKGNLILEATPHPWDVK